MKKFGKIFAVFLITVFLFYAFSGQTYAYTKNQGSNVTLKIQKTNYTKKTCQLIKGDKVTITA